MKKRSSSIPLLVIVAVIALVLGSVGTATAAGLTKGQVKKIAAKVVKKKAPTLSVAHAKTADTATNATNLNGLSAAAYQDNATFIGTAATSPIAVTTDTTILGPASITVPTGRSLVRVTGNMTMAGAGGSFVIYLAADGVCTGVAPAHAVYSGVPTTGPISATVDCVFAATPGVHAYRFCSSATAGQAAYTRTLTLQTLSGGTRTATPPARGTNGSSLTLR